MYRIKTSILITPDVAILDKSLAFPHQKWEEQIWCNKQQLYYFSIHLKIVYSKKLLNKGKASDLKHTINMSFVELTWAICYYILQYCTEAFVSNTKEEVTQRIKPQFLLRYTAGNSNEGGSYQIYEGSVSLWEWFATGSPERSWNLCPWGFSTPTPEQPALKSPLGQFPMGEKPFNCIPKAVFLLLERIPKPESTQNTFWSLMELSSW